MAREDDDAFNWDGDDDPTLTPSRRAAASAAARDGATADPAAGSAHPTAAQPTESVAAHGEPGAKAASPGSPDSAARTHSEADEPHSQAAAAASNTDADALTDVAVRESGASAEPVDGAGETSDADRSDVADQTDNTEDARPGLSNFALITFGVLGGVYLFWSIGWFIAGNRVRTMTDLGGGQVDAMTIAATILAVAAPAIWFVTTWILTRRVATWQRILWLVAGVVVLVPWPFMMIGAIGA